MDYGAITLDTSIFVQHGLKLESGLLKTLEQFNGKPSPLILSEIIVREVISHLKKKANESKLLVEKAIRESPAHLSLTSENVNIARLSLMPEISDKEIAENRMTAFYNSAGAIQIPVATVELDAIVRKYFDHEPPFAGTGKKKSEFPDAIALISLEQWAKGMDAKILAVSKDPDWEKFAEASEYVDIEKDLGPAISKFQSQSQYVSIAEDFYRKLVDSLTNGELSSDVRHGLLEALLQLDPTAKGTSQFIFKPNYIDVELNQHEFLKKKHFYDVFPLIQIQDDVAIIQGNLSIDATVSAEFTLFTNDSIDGDLVEIGQSFKESNVKFESMALLTLEGDFTGDIKDLELTGVELMSYPREIDFGEIEPVWL